VAAEAAAEAAAAAAAAEAAAEAAAGGSASTDVVALGSATWPAGDLQAALCGEAFGAWYQAGPAAASLALADPLWQLHQGVALASAAAAASDGARLQEPPSFAAAGLHELQQAQHKVRACGAWACVRFVGGVPLSVVVALLSRRCLQTSRT
jgi:hypothetical protein